MSARRWVAFLAAAAPLLLGSPARAQTAGVLVATPDSTYWIVDDSARVLHLALPGIVVPRRTGFWRIGAVTACGDPDPEISHYNVVWAAPVGQRARILEPESCAQAREERRACFTMNVSVEFVGTDFVALTRNWDPQLVCSGGGGHNDEYRRVHRLPGRAGAVDENRTVAFEELTGEAGARAVEAALPRFTARDSADLCEDTGADGWTLVRDSGRWSAIAFAERGHYRCAVQGRISMPPPTSVTGPDVLAVPWATVIRLYPEAEDAFTAPRGDLLVVRSGGRLRVHRLTPAGAGPLLGVIPVGGRVLMIQWAVGPTTVARWDRELRAIARGRPPSVRVVRRRSS